jgi:putative ABC transport system substrate-binding protein
MRRREFITLLGGAAAAWPLAARAEQPERMRRIGVLMPFAENDPEAKASTAAFRKRLQELGWTDGRNLRIDYRYSAGGVDLFRASAAELVALQPDVIVARSTPAAAAVFQETRTNPDCVHYGGRSDRQPVRPELAAAGGQHHRLHPFRAGPGRKVAAAA